jgi:hypothetical protein
MYDLGLDECSLYNPNRLVYDLTHTLTACDVPSNTQYNTSSNVLGGTLNFLGGNFEHSRFKANVWSMQKVLIFN